MISGLITFTTTLWDQLLLTKLKPTIWNLTANIKINTNFRIVYFSSYKRSQFLLLKLIMERKNQGDSFDNYLIANVEYIPEFLGTCPNSNFSSFIQKVKVNVPEYKEVELFNIFISVSLTYTLASVT